MKHKVMHDLYLREATLMLLLAKLAVHVAPPARVLSWARRPLIRKTRFNMTAVGWVRWSIETIGAKPWMNAACLPRALAAHAMLRRRGIGSRLCLGVDREGAGAALSAHAWLELGQNIVVGGEEAPRFTKLMEFGGKQT